MYFIYKIPKLESFSIFEIIHLVTFKFIVSKQNPQIFTRACRVRAKFTKSRGSLHFVFFMFQFERVIIHFAVSFVCFFSNDDIDESLWTLKAGGVDLRTNCFLLCTTSLAPESPILMILATERKTTGIVSKRFCK